MANSVVTVPVKSAWASKINWINAVGALVALAAALGIPVDEHTKDLILTGAGIITPVITMILRTWFTRSITAGAAANT